MFRLLKCMCRTSRIYPTTSRIAVTNMGTPINLYKITRKFATTKTFYSNLLLSKTFMNFPRPFPWMLRFRLLSGSRSFNRKSSNVDVVYYVASGIIFMIGVAYASVPLYRMFCQATGIGGDPNIGHKTENVGTMKPIRERPLTILFNADRHAAMQWNFKPSQTRVKVVPGETALAFYTAKNPTDTPIVGVATYNVVPFQAGPYFNKIQCFCFEEQWLNPHEEVDMPVFFYIDPEFDDDPQLANVDEIVLSYTFFKADEGQILPVPGFMNAKFKAARPETATS